MSGSADAIHRIAALAIAGLTLGRVPATPQVLGAAAIVAGTIVVRLGRIERALAARYPAE